MITIRPASEADLDTALTVERAAFGEDEEAELVRDLQNDPSAQPTLSLLAWEKGRAVGHILFTAARVEGTTENITSSLLAPLAVIPERQNQGIGGALIRDGLKRLANQGVDLVFVLGHPEYYPRHGFQTAGRLGLDAPYPIAEKNAGAWMVQELRPGIIETVQGTLKCADTLDHEMYWVE